MAALAALVRVEDLLDGAREEPVVIDADDVVGGNPAHLLERLFAILDGDGVELRELRQVLRWSAVMTG
jgi:hypothetical protein